MPHPETARLDAQMAFLSKADDLKGVDRMSVLMDRSRPENVAEHSWHAALWALVLAEHAPDGCDLGRAIAMLLIHDLVEIDTGHHSVDAVFDSANVADKKRAAAERLFGLLPADQGAELMALWQEFETAETPTAVYARRIDHMHPILQVLQAPKWKADHASVAHHSLLEGCASQMALDWPDMHAHADALLSGQRPVAGALSDQLRFLAEADSLKSVKRATRVLSGSRHENSAEHSWHVALYALVLSEHAPQRVDAHTVITMLLLHDLVEIDAGDAPVFGNHDTARIEAEEAAAAERIFGLLPETQAQELRALWDRFEAKACPEARFAKALDRFNPPNQNLAAGGGSWVDYKVDRAKFEANVGSKIAEGAPILWDWIAPRAFAMIDRLQKP